MLHITFSNSDRMLCEGDLEPSTADYCSETPINYYLRTYAIILGDFALEEYRQASGVTLIFLVITAFGSIIMLNVLIAGK